MNHINYFKHSLFTPDTYHRRYDLDIQEKQEDSDWLEYGKRISLIALPWISLYRPAGTAISLSMGTFRVITHLNAAWGLQQTEEGYWTRCGLEFLETSVAIVAVVGTIFVFKIGLYITTVFDLTQGLGRILQVYFAEGKTEEEKQLLRQQLIDELLQTLSSFLYLAFMISGALELMLLFSFIQGAGSLYQSRNEFAKGRYLEGISKAGMGCVRFGQTANYWQLIEKRNAAYKIQKYQELLARCVKARQTRHLIANPLSGNLKKEINGRQVVLFNGQRDCKLGSYVHGYGKGLVKGANLTFRTVVVNEKEMVELDFKVNHCFRKNIDESLETFKKFSSQEISEFLPLTGSNVTGIRVEKEALLVGDTKIQGAVKNSKIILEGLGSISVCMDPKRPTLYDRVVVRIDAEKTVFDLHELVSFVNLEEALCRSSNEDLERLKLGHLFHTLCPREALQIERNEEFFSLPIDRLKEKMIAMAPEMDDHLGKYLPNIYAAETLPGKIRYRIGGLAEEATELGTRALISTIMSSDKELFPRVESLLRMGMLSSELRCSNNLNANGISSQEDFKSGGADSVFTQMLTEQNFCENLPFSVLPYSGKIRMIISPDILETGTYQYPYDSFGVRRVDGAYASRLNPLEFTKMLQEMPARQGWDSPWWPFESNEVMIKDRIDPSFFKGIVVENQKTYDSLLTYLHDKNLIQIDLAGIKTILGHTVDRFIQVATHASANVQDLLRE
jgi:hypothetical protein